MDRLIDSILNLIFKRTSIVLIVVGACFILTGISNGISVSGVSWYIYDEDYRRYLIFFGGVVIFIGLLWLNTENSREKIKNKDNSGVALVTNKVQSALLKRDSIFQERRKNTASGVNGEVLIALTKGLSSSSTYSVIQESINNISTKLTYLQVYQITSKLDSFYRSKCLKLLIPKMRTPITGSQAVYLISGINLSSVRSDLLLMLTPLLQYPLTEREVTALLSGLTPLNRQRVSLNIARYSKIR